MKEIDLLDMFVFDDELALWEAELASHSGLARLNLLTKLAWHLRQRDGARARQLAQDAQALLALLPPDGRAALQARFTLIEAEAAWLLGQLDAAQALAEQALAGFGSEGADIGSADAHWLLAWIAVDGGHAGVCDAELDLAALDAAAAGDAVRGDVFDAAAAIFSVFRDAQTAAAHWGAHFDPDLTRAHPVVAGWISDFFGTSAFQTSDFGRAIGHLVLTYERARASGQLRRAINVATNIGNAFTSLNAHEAALEWMQRGLDLARPTGWPMSVGLCLMQTAETLRLLGQREAARDLLREALATLAPLSGSRAYAIALEYQGDLALDRGDYGAALDSFARLEERGDALRQSDFQSGARRGRAHALSHLGRPDEALAAAAAALALAREQGDAYNQIAALTVLAEIHARHALPGPAPLAAACAALHYLQLALSLASTIDGYTVPGSLLDAAAREYAQAGDHASAYRIALRAGAARDKIHNQDATKRAVAMQIQYQTERARTEVAHHRQLAEAEARRAEVLQQTSLTLEHLSAIGQEITAHLDAQAVFGALDRHVHGLLETAYFSIFLLEPDGLHLHCAFGTEAGRALPATRFALTDPHMNSARCVR
ncbi:MAG TPA: GGDEF domain-containing protein, partial [Janthinobacterium sp.]|nr:GGDEF domain-containing protein [Janthinobacterium sp.]